MCLEIQNSYFSKFIRKSPFCFQSKVHSIGNTLKASVSDSDPPVPPPVARLLSSRPVKAADVAHLV